MHRLTYLPAAERLHRAPAGVKIQTARIPRQSDGIDQPANLGFGIYHHGFILHFDDRQRRYRLPVMHQPFLLRDHEGDVVQIGSVGGRRRETLAENRQRDVAWIAATPDDARIGEQHRDQTDMQKIVRLLVDQPADIRAVNIRGRSARGQPQIIRSVDTKHIRVDARGVLRPTQTGLIRQPVRDSDDAGQFAATVGLRMRGDDLFDQRRAAARHTDDENRTLVRQRRTTKRCK